MRQYWTAEEIAEHWTLLLDENLLLRNKTGDTRLGFAVGLKFFQMHGRFPQYSDNIPKAIIVSLAKQVGVEVTDAAIQYAITKDHRTEIRDFLGFRKATDDDA